MFAEPKIKNSGFLGPGSYRLATKTADNTTIKMSQNRYEDVVLRNLPSLHNQEIYTVIADAKIRELQSNMERSHSPRPTVMHFSDGTLKYEDLDDYEDGADEEPAGPTIDPKTLPWAPWVWYQALTVGGQAIKVCDYMGERLADFFGITTPKYQLELDERLAIMEEDKAEQLHQQEDQKNWSGTGPDLQDNGDKRVNDNLIMVTEQPGSPGDALAPPMNMHSII